jgi:RNA polymerase sigma-70 factor (ECF subfamily)
MEKCDDRQLIDDYLIGREAALRTVTRWIEVALRTGHPLVHADLEDLRQEVQARVLGNLRDGRFDGRSTLRTYVHRIAINTRLDATRRRSRKGAREAPIDGLEERLPAAEMMTSDPDRVDLAARIMNSVSEGDRMLLRLVFAENLPYAEIARRLGVSESAVKTRMMRCKNRLVRRFGRLVRPGAR